MENGCGCNYLYLYGSSLVTLALKWTMYGLISGTSAQRLQLIKIMASSFMERSILFHFLNLILDIMYLASAAIRLVYP